MIVQKTSSSVATLAHNGARAHLQKKNRVSEPVSISEAVGVLRSLRVRRLLPAETEDTQCVDRVLTRPFRMCDIAWRLGCLQRWASLMRLHVQTYL